ncbi:MAG: hypothetical protein K2P81_11440, partial [Bacteriovoracaceae bacterium]|nr:hypothetical protein [Bacteriovoracaceae bacterium]
CIYWASAPVGLIQLPPAWSTGSSIMPNKRNPDVAELVRGKASLWMGEASGVLTLLKGMPTSYGSDLHESKIPYLNTSLDVKRSLEVFKHFIIGLTPSPTRAQQMLQAGHILATEIADHLASQGVSFREAYGQVAALVEVAESKNIQCHEIPEEEALKLAPGLKPGFMNSLSFKTAVEKRANAGGTSLKCVLEQIEKLSAFY